MSRSELTPFSYVVLTLVGEGGAGPHDIVRMMRRGRIYWTAAESHYYAEPKRLARLGYLVAKTEPGRTRERTHYELTEKGRAAIRRWLSVPAALPRTQNEAVVKLLAADLAGEEAALESLVRLREDVARAAAELDVADAVAQTLPQRQRYLRLVHGLGRRLLAAHLDWLDEVEAELGRGGGAAAGR